MAIAILISTFGCNNGLILSGARVYYAMARDGLFFRRAGDAERESVPAVGADRAVDLDEPALPHGHVRPAAQLRDLRGADVLRADDDRAVHPAREAAGRRASVSGGRLSGPAGAVHRARSGDGSDSADRADKTRAQALSGLVLVLIGIPVFFIWRRVEACSTLARPRRAYASWRVHSRRIPMHRLAAGRPVPLRRSDDESAGRRYAIGSVALAALLALSRVRSRCGRCAQDAGRSGSDTAGGEANLVIPDLRTVQFLGIPGHTLLMAGLVVCALGLLFGLVIYGQLKRCRCTSRCARSPS